MRLVTKTIQTSGFDFLAEGNKVLAAWGKPEDKTEFDLSYKDFAHSPYFGDTNFSTTQMPIGPLLFYIPAKGFPGCCGGVLLTNPAIYSKLPLHADLARAVLNTILSKHSLVYLAVDFSNPRGNSSAFSLFSEFKKAPAWKGQYGDYQMNFYIREKGNFLPYEFEKKTKKVEAKE